jgi:hypothetical protein
MIWPNYHLGDTVSKATEAVRLWQAEKGVVEISKGTLTIHVKLDGHVKGYIFLGHGRLILDTIVETENGAIGKPVDREIDRPFLMLGKAEGMQQSFSLAGQEDFSETGCSNQQEFVAEAEGLLDRFSRRGRIHDYRHSSDGNGLVFAFQNEANGLDILLANGAELVYKAMNTVFVSNKDRAVLKSSGGVVCISNGKSVIVKR